MCFNAACLSCRTSFWFEGRSSRVPVLALLRLGGDLAPPVFSGQRQTLFHNRELQLALLREDAIQNHLHVVAGAEAAARALADNLMRILAPGVAVVAQRVDGHQPFDKQIGQLDKEPVFSGVQHQRGKLLADLVLHEANLLPLHQLAFGLGCASLGLAGLFGNLRQFGLGDGRLNL